MESDLTTLLKTICARTYPDFAPAGTLAPYVVWQGLGGQPSRLLNNQAGDKRNTYLQVSVWSSSRAEALQIIRQIEDAMCAATAFLATSHGEPLSTYEPDTGLRGSVQRFSVWSAR